MSERLSNEPQRLKATLGQHVEQFAQELIEYANAHHVDVEGEFNDIIFRVSSGDPVAVEDVVRFYSEESNRRAEEYRKSLAGVKAAEAAEARNNAAQEKADLLLVKLDSLDFNNLEAVIDWIVDFQDASSVRVSFDWQRVISIFSSHGFDVNINTGEDFNSEDAENFAKWLVGQALDGIGSMGSIHNTVHKSAKDWKERYGQKAKAEQKKIEDIRNGLQ